MPTTRDAQLLVCGDEVLLFEHCKKLRSLSCADRGFDVEFLNKFRCQPVDGLAVLEKRPDATARLIKLQINPVVDVEKEGLLLDVCRDDLWGSFVNKGCLSHDSPQAGNRSLEAGYCSSGTATILAEQTTRFVD